MLLLPPCQPRRHQGKGLLPLPCQGRQDCAEVCGNEVLTVAALPGKQILQWIAPSLRPRPPWSARMSDVNPGQEPLPVIPADDLGQFTAEPLTPQPAILERKGHPIIAWIVICLCVAFILRQQFLPAAQGEQQDETISLINMKMQAKYLVGCGALLGKNAAFAGQAKNLNTGPIDQRLRAIVLEGELSGPKAALDALKDLQNRIASNQQNPTATQIKLMGVLRRLYEDYANDKWDAPTLTVEERTF